MSRTRSQSPTPREAPRRRGLRLRLRLRLRVRVRVRVPVALWGLWGLLGWLVPLPPAAAQSACDPSTMCCAAFDSGSTCGGAGVATMGNVSGLDLGVGNPINLLNGNKFQREVDMPALPGVLGLELVRYYNSADSRNGLLGRGWRLSYETELRVRPRGLEVVQADGTRIFFGAASVPDGVHRPRDPMQGLVQRRPGARGTEYLWRWADGRELRFNARGRLEQIRVPSGEFVSLRYDERGWLSTVIDPAGRRLDLQYLDKAGARRGERFRGVQSIETPVGRYRYEHQGILPAGSTAPPSEVLANLTRVRYPATEGGPGGEAVSRQYHHEDARFPSLLTGISAHGLARSERLSTWAYDAKGRAVRSEASSGIAASGVMENVVSLRWQIGPKGKARVQVDEGPDRSTVYTTGWVAGERRILRADGATRMQYAYDALGRVIEQTRLDAEGRPLLTQRTERDVYGRPMRLSDIPYQAGRAQTALWRARYRYAEPDPHDSLAVPDPRPLFIATPSVVAGRERRVHLVYNAARQLESVREEGFSPVDEQGQEVPEGVPMSRVMRYRYGQLNGRSVLVSSDGPLPNGALHNPSDSDVTLYEWDTRGERLLRVTRPGQLTSHLRHEALTGRLLGVTDPAGVLIELRDHVAALGRPRVMQSGDRQSRLSFDLRGRVSQVKVGEAIVWQATSGPRDAAAEPAAVLYHDAWDRPTVWYADGGDPVLAAQWGGIGSAAERSVLRWDVDGAYAQRELDDFGRAVAIRHLGQRWRHATFDAADRIVATTDARGARQRVFRDTAGRAVRIEYWSPGDHRAQQVVSRRYEGERLMEETVQDQDGTRRTHSAYDARGAMVSETLTIEPAGELALSMRRSVSLRIAYAYGAGGELLERQITDATGHTLRVEQALDSQGQLARLESRGVLPRWLGGGREIVRGVDWQLLTSLQYAVRIEHGDGSVDTFESLPLGAALRAPPIGAGRDGYAAVSPIASPEPDHVRLRVPKVRRAKPPGLNRDNAGLPTFLHTGLGLQGLQWNAAGQLARTQREGARSRYIYDARGRRVATLVIDDRRDTQLRLALYEDHRLMAEADAQGRLTYAYVHLGQRPVAQIVLNAGHAWAALKAWLFGPRVRHLHTARAGRVLSMSELGHTVWRDGEAQSPVDEVHQPLRYVGQYHDADSGLDYHGARFFDPGQGRFISPDPSGVADAIDGVVPSRLLDLYAYAGGQPDEFFDPDGAARIRYFAITSNAQGKPLGSTQGFVKARWSFIVDNVKGGGGGDALGQLRNRYAAAGVSLLVDVAGNFLEGGASSRVWGGPEATMAQTFFRHYGDKLISIPQFTIEDMNDDEATKLIARYIEADKRSLPASSCESPAALLPPIRFAEEELPIDVTQVDFKNPSNTQQVWAGSQRIVQCGEKSNGDVVERRIQKYNFGFMLLESNPPQIYMDCSKDGCPGRSLRGTVLSGYVASYGQTQFIGATMVEKLQMLRAGALATAAERAALKLDDKVLWEAVLQAKKRADFVAEKFKAWKADAPQWEDAGNVDRNEFITGTGLDEVTAKTIWNDIRRWFAQPSPNLAGEARAAFGTTVLMHDPVVREYLMEIFQDSKPGGKFSMASLALVRDNYAQIVGRVDTKNGEDHQLPYGGVNPLWEQRQRQIELELAARTARMHNGDLGKAASTGSFAEVWRRDSSADGRQYARRFLNSPEYPVRQPTDPRRQQPVGDYFALRCATQLPKTIGKLGLQMTPLKTP